MELCALPFPRSSPDPVTECTHTHTHLPDSDGGPALTIMEYTHLTVMEEVRGGSNYMVSSDTETKIITKSISGLHKTYPTL